MFAAQIWLAIAGCGLIGQVASDAVAQGSPSLYCADLHPQNSVDIQQITGMWYGSELLQHHEGYEGETTENSCVVIHLSETTAQMATTTEYPELHHGYYDQERRYKPQGHKYNYLRLIWDEKGLDLEYTLRYNQTRRGFWISSSPQKGGSSLQDLNYNQFTGTLQVLKAVSNHMVLTFCQTLPKGQLFSIILTRKPNTLTADLTGDWYAVGLYLHFSSNESHTIEYNCPKIIIKDVTEDVSIYFNEVEAASQEGPEHYYLQMIFNRPNMVAKSFSIIRFNHSAAGCWQSSDTYPYWKWEDLDFDLTTLHFHGHMQVIYGQPHLLIVNVCDSFENSKSFTVVYYRRREPLHIEERNVVYSIMAQRRLLANMTSIDICMTIKLK